MKEKLNSWQLGLTYAGCFLGAGYVSGQELWQFFGAFESWRLGLILALFLIFLFGCISLMTIFWSQKSQAADIVVRKDRRILKGTLNGTIALFLYAVLIIMSAGVGAVAEQLFGLPAKIFSTLACFGYALFSLGGVKSMVQAFSAVVPVLTIMAAAVSLRICLAEEISFNTVVLNGDNFGGWWSWAALVFVAHNLFGAVGILTPVGVKLKDGKSIIKGVALGVGILGMIAFLVLKAMHTLPISASKQLPMLYLAAYCGDIVGLIYGLLLILAMSTSALASLVALEEMVLEKKHFKRSILALILVFAGAIGASGGFSNLISIIYPLCGYVGIVVLVGLTEHFIFLCRKRKSTE